MKMSIEPGFAWIPPSELERRLAVIPVPQKLKSSFISVLNRWIVHSGMEWTVGRCKAFKDCLLGSKSSGQLANKPEWFTTTRSGKLAGVWGSLYRFAMEDSASLKAVLTLVNLYTAVRRTEHTASMLSDIKSEIQQEASPYRVSKRGKLGRASVYKAFKQLPCRLPRFSWGRYRGEPLSVILPGKEGHAENLEQDILSLAGSPLYAEHRRVLDEALGADIGSVLSSRFSTVVGSVGLTHEPGLKTRYFASPNVVIQRALEPLKDYFLDVVAKIPWDCTMDQRKADSVIRSSLAKGKRVHSVDMSKATDNFPWLFQDLVMTHLVKSFAPESLQPLCRLMRTVVRDGWWIMPDNSRVQWTKGQPLGLGPSFPIFTMSHGLLLFILNEYKWERAFYVLGDDVVIFDDLLASKYREVLKSWGVQVSETKSFASAQIAQFAGVTYTPDMHMHVPKWVPFTRENLLDLQAWWYPGLTKGLPDHTLIEWVLSLPQPYGLGWNPKGLPLEARLTDRLVEVLLDAEERRELRPKAAATRDALHELAVIMEGNPNAYPIYRLLKDRAPKEQSLLSQRPHPDRGVLKGDVVPLSHGTDLPWYPKIRRRIRVDQYSKGTIHAWKQVWSAANS